MDGRLKEQARKMQLGFEHRYVIIEGDVFGTGSMINENAVIGSMTSLLVKQGIKLLQVKNELQFVEACYSIVKKHQEDNSFNPEFVPCTIPKKSDEDILAMMLIQLNGISYSKAKSIAELYGGSLFNLVNNANDKEIKSIDGIGKVLATRIVEFVKK
jgi:ERCC4-type nuclease